MPSDLDQAKRRLRKAGLAARRDAAREAPEAARRVAGRLLELAAATPSDIVAGYRAVRSELDPLPALQALHARGIRLCLPVVAHRDLPLVFRLWAPLEPLRPDAFGVEIPARASPAVPTLVILPLLAWDRRGTRLGYGGGFYDRSLHALRRTQGFRMAVGLAFASQEVEEVPRADTDEPLDALVTERETLRWRLGCEF